MNAIKKARRLITANPTHEGSLILAHLVRALESDESFDMGILFTLDYENFNLVLEILKEWRLDRYYMGKAKLIDLAVRLATPQ